MYRKSFIIKKENLFNWMSSEKVSKIEIANCYNKTLKDKTLCKIYVYLKIQIAEFHSIFGGIDLNLDKVDSHDRQYIKGLKTLKGEGFIAEKHIIRLKEIEKRNNINLNISENILKMSNFKESNL